MVGYLLRFKICEVKKMNDVNTIILEFIDAAINNGIAQEDGNANQANKFYRVIEKRTKWLTEQNELCNPFFLELLYHENDYVKYYASCALLHERSDEALSTLSYLSEKRGILGFSSKMTIVEFKKGNI